VFGSIFVLGITSGHFTRLVVTDHRLVILQGYEMCRSWNMNELPPSLIRFTMQRSGGGNRAIDLDTLKLMLGADSDKVVDAKTILGFGKHLDHIKARENDRP